MDGIAIFCAYCAAAVTFIGLSIFGAARITAEAEREAELDVELDR
tara:strand:+ start:473 stop:607 length:135 start_codon:yes stop_codon:yes gene_type:complete